jgi:hypothetical protein
MYSQAFLGPKAIALEHSGCQAKLSKVCHVQQKIYNRQLLLNLATNGFDYLVTS